MDVRTNDSYPWSSTVATRSGTARECPICEGAIPEGAYALHWEAVHPAQSAYLRVIESAPELVDEWADVHSFAVPDGYLDGRGLSRAQLRHVADVWTETHGSFMDAVFALLDALD